VCIVANIHNILETIGGPSSFNYSLISWLSENNIKVSLVYRKQALVEVLQNPSYSSPYKSKVPKVHMFHLPFSIYQVLQLFFCSQIIIRLVNLNKKERISVIHSQDTHHGALASIIAGALLNVPVIVHAHETYAYLSGLNPLSKGVQLLVHRLVMKHSARIIAVSRTLSQLLVTGFGASPSRVKVAAIGINVGRFRSRIGKNLEARNLLGIDKDAFVVGYIGRLSIEKNVKSLIRAVDDLMVSGEVENTILLVIGDGPEKKKLEELSKGLTIKHRILFAGYRTDVPDIIQAIDVLALPSLTEACPTVVLEAKAAGKATISSDISTIREIISDEETGLLVNPIKIEEIKEAILKLYNYPELRKKLTDNAFYEAAHYDQTEIFGKIFQTYKDLTHPWVWDENLSGLSVIIPSAKPKLYTKNCLPEGVEVIVERSRGLATARNRGAQKAHGGFLVFMDDDLIFSREFFWSIVEKLRKNKKSFIAMGARPTECTSRVLVIRRNDFYRIGGFDEWIKFIGEDFDFGCRAVKLGYKKILIPFTSVKHVEHGRSLSGKIWRFIEQSYILVKHPREYCQEAELGTFIAFFLYTKDHEVLANIAKTVFHTLSFFHSLFLLILGEKTLSKRNRALHNK
jgi:glycosyltransferase involved in cell wall biosynthesis